MAELSSRTTHAAQECLEACRLLAVALERALAGGPRDAVLDLSNVPVESARLQQIAAGGYRGAAREQIRGNGYVVDSVEAALWCFDRHDTFEAVVLEAANLGEDADTTAAIAGQLAGAFHGARNPRRWLQRLALRAEIQALADALHALNQGSDPRCVSRVPCLLNCAAGRSLPSPFPTPRGKPCGSSHAAAASLSRPRHGKALWSGSTSQGAAMASKDITRRFSHGAKRK